MESLLLGVFDIRGKGVGSGLFCAFRVGGRWVQG